MSINTVTGTVNVEDPGFTLIREHLTAGMPGREPGSSIKVATGGIPGMTASSNAEMPTLPAAGVPEEKIKKLTTNNLHSNFKK